MQDGTLSSLSSLEETTPIRGNVYAADCPTRRLLDRIGDKWSVLILLLLGEEALRFSILKQRIGGISQKMLSQTLRSLERDGLVRRVVGVRMPVSVTYHITPLGSDLLEALRLMIDWAETRMGEVEAAQRAFREGQEGEAN